MWQCHIALQEKMAFSHEPIVATLTVTFMSALPKEVNLDPNGVSAWNMLLAAEEAALKMDTGTSAKYRNELVGVRILGFFLLDFYKHSYHQIGLQFHIIVCSRKLYRVSGHQ